jgi:hypothetical protein
VVYTTPLLVAGQGATVTGISGTVNVTPGTAATGITVRVRQGSLTGPVVGASPLHTVAAAAPQNISFGASDFSTFLESPNQYVITIQQAAATGNGATNMVDVEVLV